MKQPPVEPTPSAGRGRTSDVAVACLVALALFGVYLLSFNGRITSSDGLAMFAVTESLIKRGDVSTDQMWTFFGTKTVAAPDGQVYSKYGYGTSLFAAPFYALAFYVPFSGLMQVTLLSSALAIALTGTLLYLAARELRFSPIVSVIAAFLFGLATPAWVYAKEFWSEPFAALTLFAAFYFLLRYRTQGDTRTVVVAGISLGLAITVRTTNVLLVPLYLGYAFVAPARDMLSLKNTGVKQAGVTSRIQWRMLFLFLAPVLLLSVSVLAYNWLRFQNPFTTGYRADENFNNNILLGAYGLLFSPGKGLFVFAPFLAALPFGVWQFYRRFRPELGLAVSLFIVHVLLFSAWYYWWGGTNWAARFLVPTLPFLVLLCAPLVELVFVRNGTDDITSLSPFDPSHFTTHVLRLTFFALVAVSVLNELAGVAVNSLTYRLRMLNLSQNPDWDSIFLPAFSPLIGHWQTLKPTNLDVAWVRATPETIQIDWLAIGLILLFIACCTIGFVSALSQSRNGGKTVLSLVALGIGVTVIVLARAADDPRFGGSDGYAALLQTVEQQSSPNDVLVLNDDAYARYFFNTNRASLKWYGLARDPARWDDATETLVASLLHRAPRVWFAYDDAVDAPNPMRDWFEARGRALQRLEFGQDVTLVLYKEK